MLYKKYHSLMKIQECTQLKIITKKKLGVLIVQNNSKN